MKIAIFFRMDGNLEVLDLHREEAPLMTVLFHGDAANIPAATKFALVEQMAKWDKPRIWPIALIWGVVGLGCGYILACAIAFLRAM